ncbi:MAG: hypothetical protein M3Z40_07980, partial [Bifidobacterium sp.]|nr:hypothetical protein [Bifidobacterium sp.]
MPMTRRTGRHGTHRSLVGTVSVAVVLALVGYMLTTNIRVNRTVTVTSDTAGLVEERENKAAELRKDINDMSSQINALKTL